MDDVPGGGDGPVGAANEPSGGADEVVARLRESLYTAVGFAVLGVQQSQVRRRELRKNLARLAVEVDDRLDPVLDGVEARLPDDLRPLLAQARSAARDVQRSVLGPSGPASGAAGVPPRR